MNQLLRRVVVQVGGECEICATAFLQQMFIKIS